MSDQREGGQSSLQPKYWVWVLEQGRALDTHEIEDPFINTSIRPRGWRNALAVLFGRYEVIVRVDGSSETVEAVMELNPDYLGAPGSERRRRWEAELQGALRSFTGESHE